MRVLYVYAYPSERGLRSTELVSLALFSGLPEVQTTLLNVSKGPPEGSRALLKLQQRLTTQKFDLVLYHYSFLGQRAWGPLFPNLRDRWAWLSDLKGFKVALPQDEGSYSALLEDWMLDLGVEAVGSVHFERNSQILYQSLKKAAHIFPVLPGYLPSKNPFAEDFVLPNRRDFTVGYWARNLPYWVGSHGQLKGDIGRAALALKLPGRIDISVSATSHLQGRSWTKLLGNSLITLGAEGGYSALDRYGEVRALYEYFQTQVGTHGSFEDFDRTVFPGWDDYQLFTITPRHLEAAALGCVMVLVEGQYSDVLQSGLHYVPVKKDFSNLREALDIAQAPQEAEMLRRNAYKDLVSPGKYSIAALASHILNFLK